MAPTSKVYCLCHLPEDGHFMIIVINGIMVTVQVSHQTLGRKWRMITRNIFVPAALQILRTLVSPASVDPPTPSVINSCEPCVDFQWGDKDGETFCKLIGDAFEVVVYWRC